MHRKPVLIVPQNAQVRKVQIVKKLDLVQPRDVKSESDLKAEEEEEEEDEEEEEVSQSSSEQDPFLNFVNSYSTFMNDAHNSTLDLQTVYERMNEAITQCKPPNTSWASLHESLGISRESVDALAQQLRQLPDMKLYQCVQNVEKLNVKLQLDYQVEVKRGKTLNIINQEEK